MQSELQPGPHVAIIMDGNGRWAARRGLPRVAGHRAGVAAARRTIERASDAGVRCLTLYAFSSDNWRRPPNEVKSIFWLLRTFLRIETEKLRQRGARLTVIGRRDRLPAALVREMVRAESGTADGRGLRVRVAVDYSSRDAIASAARSSYEAHQSVSADLLTHELTAESGDVDLLIRTGGEQRLSDFLLWECAYAELVFTERTWPDFDGADLDAALEEFSRRQRNFGGLPATNPRTSLAASGGIR
jgi:undecaprenyl diphosphate synthase